MSKNIYNIKEKYLQARNDPEGFSASIMQPEKHLDVNHCCIFINSGRTSVFDSNKEETKSFAEIKKAIALKGISSIEFDLPERKSNNNIADTEEINKRYQRLITVLTSDFFQPYLKSYMLIGLSLGGQIIVNLLCDNNTDIKPAKSIILLSTVIEKPTFIHSDVKNIHLIYGSRDCIAYCQGDDVGEIVTPSKYSETSKKFLITKQSQKKHIHILQGVGHLMDYREIDGIVCTPQERITSVIYYSLLESDKSNITEEANANN